LQRSWVFFECSAVTPSLTVPSTMLRNWTVTFVESRTLMTSPLLSVVTGGFGMPRTVDVRSLARADTRPVARPGW